MNTYFTPLGLTVAALFACGTAHAALPGFENYAAATDAELDAMRGGFEFNINGMQVTPAFSLEQLTYVNGQLVSSMKLTPLQFGPVATTPASTMASVPPPTDTSPPAQTAQSGMLAVPVATQVFSNQGIVNLVQVGPGNNYTLPQSLSALTEALQNTANDQVIRNLTIMNATLSIQQAAAAMRLGAALNQMSAAGLR